MPPIEDHILYKGINSVKNLKNLRQIILKIIYDLHKINISPIDENFVKDLKSITKDISKELLPQYIKSRLSIPYIIKELNKILIEDIVNIVSIKIKRQFKETPTITPRTNKPVEPEDNIFSERMPPQIMETPLDMLEDEPSTYCIQEEILRDLQKEQQLEPQAIPEHIKEENFETVQPSEFLDLEECQESHQELKQELKQEVNLETQLITEQKEISFCSSSLEYNENKNEYYLEGLYYPQVESIILKDITVPNSDYYITEYNNSFKINNTLIKIEPNDYTLETLKKTLQETIDKEILNQIYIVSICENSYKITIKSGDTENKSMSRTNKIKKQPRPFTLDFSVDNSCYTILGFLKLEYKNKLEYTSEFKINVKPSRVMKLLINLYNCKYNEKINNDPVMTIEKQLKMNVNKQEDYTQEYSIKPLNKNKIIPKHINLIVISFKYLIDNSPVQFRNYPFLLNTILSQQDLSIKSI